MSDLYGEAERARESLWARKEDAKAIEKLRRKLDAESQMTDNVIALKDKTKN